MADDESRIRALIENWAAAVHAGDMAAVLADHTADILMFDVPPPYAGVHGIDAYRASWPGFFEWQAGGAVFEIESLDVTAGADVAFATALLRCGTTEQFAENPDQRLRLTLGLRNVDGQWSVAHEHHSFSDTTDPGRDEADVRAVHAGWTELTAAKDLDGLMEHIADDIVSYEHGGPLAYVGRADVREVCRAGLESSTGAVSMETPELTVRVGGDLAVSWGIDHIGAEQPDGAVAERRTRGTRIFRKRATGWEMIHQHLSVPEGS